VAKSRPYEQDSDLRLMQSLAAHSTRLLGPMAPVHVGDLTWGMYQHLNKLDEARAQLWLEDGACVAWGWLKGGTLDALTHPERPELLDDVLAWADADVVYTSEADVEKIARLHTAGYRRSDDGRVFNHMARELDGVPAPELPDGYRVRPVRGEEELLPRVEVHRVVWAPSRVVPESYGRLMREWPYRADLDFVVEAPDGSLAAFCLAWLDPDNAVGLFEPVGTHPDHRRRGLGAAVCLGALRGLAGAGARRAIVLSEDPSDAEALYESIGFRTVTRHVPFGKKPTEPVV
jgi:ribosomal protein S18 acetylase RimI-like enzyme